jgi:putative ABC transport system permease protein
MAGRDIRAAPRRLFLLTASVAVGVAALVAIDSFTENLRDSVQRQAQALLGADLSFVSRQPLTRRAESALDSLVAGGAELARVTSFGGMAYVPRTAGTRLVQVAAVQGRYPFYGSIRTDPAAAWSALQSGRNVVVDPSLLSTLNAQVGDTLSLGKTRFVIIGTVISAPGNTGFRAALGPRIFIPGRFLDETGLLGLGSRAEYEAFLKLRPGTSAQQIAERYRAQLRSERVRIRTVSEDQRNLNEALSRLTGYLGLVALLALLLGGIGVASAVVVFVRQRLESIAVLRCLGATGGQVLAIYGVEAAAMGLAGSVAGAAAGAVLQRVLPRALAGLLPVDVEPVLSWQALALGIGLGLWAALLFALLPMLSVRQVSPLSALRRPFEAARRAADPWRWVVLAALVVSTVALSAIQVGNVRQGAVFAAGVGGVLLVLWGASWALARSARRWAPVRWPFVWRQGLANLHRPSNQTITIVLAIGFGAFLLGTLLLVQYNLMRQLRLTGGPRRPNLVLFDIQQDQLATVQGALRDANVSSTGTVPIVPMRIQSVKGKPVSALLSDSTNVDRDGPPNAWVFRREYRSTYRDTLVASERLAAGRWWSTRSAGSPISISVERDLAGELGVRVGDEIVWDVQGVSLPSRVTSLREVEWARFEPNFFVVFAPGALETAPQTLVTLTRIESAEARGRFQRHLAELLPNVSTLDLSVLQETLERLIDRIILAIRFMALFTLATGVLVLVGALATTRFQRIREGALLRTLGATRSQIFRVVLAEYLSLGAMAAISAALLAGVAGWALARFFFEGRFALPVASLSGLSLAIVLLTVIVGLANSREVLRRTPLEVLREE